MVRGSGGVHHVTIYRSERAGTDPCGRERHLGIPGAAVHRHTLDRVNAINDSLKEAFPISQSHCRWGPFSATIYTKP